MPAQVDFYVRPETSPEAIERFACRLVETVWQRGHSVLVLAESDAAARRIDDLLWTFRDESFVPHRRLGPGGPGTSAADAPVIVSPPGLWDGELDVLLNLTAHVPDECAHAHRIAEVVPGSGPGRDAARRRFREYRDRGFELKTHR